MLRDGKWAKTNRFLPQPACCLRNAAHGTASLPLRSDAEVAAERDDGALDGRNQETGRCGTIRPSIGGYCRADDGMTSGVWFEACPWYERRCPVSLSWPKITTHSTKLANSRTLPGQSREHMCSRHRGAGSDTGRPSRSAERAKKCRARTSMCSG